MFGDRFVMLRRIILAGDLLCVQRERGICGKKKKSEHFMVLLMIMFIMATATATLIAKNIH
jgi:hypothetical protein